MFEFISYICLSWCSLISWFDDTNVNQENWYSKNNNECTVLSLIAKGVWRIYALIILYQNLLIVLVLFFPSFFYPLSKMFLLNSWQELDIAEKLLSWH